MAWHTLWTNKNPSTIETGWSALGDTNTFENAIEVYTILRNNGYTHNAACGVLGNFRHESYMNPGQWQIGFSIYSSRNDCGFGLGQWTKWTKVSDFVGSTDPDAMGSGESQMNLFLTNTAQWGHGLITKSGWSNYYQTQSIYFETMADYAADDTHTAAELATAFSIQWERGAAKYLFTGQQTNAEWYADNIPDIVSGQHKVTITVVGNGTATASPVYAAPNSVIQLTETPDEDETFSGWTVTSGGVTISDDNHFYMPDEDVNITATFTHNAYHVTVQVSGNGSAYATPRSGKSGTMITLHEDPNSGATFKGWTVVSGNVTISSDFTFTMPDSDVIIKAEFTGYTPKPSPAGKIDSGSNWWEYMRPVWTW